MAAAAGDCRGADGDGGPVHLCVDALPARALDRADHRQRGVWVWHGAGVLGHLYVPGGRVPAIRGQRAVGQQLPAVVVGSGLSAVWHPDVQPAQLPLGVVAVGVHHAGDAAFSVYIFPLRSTDSRAQSLCERSGVG